MRAPRRAATQEWEHQNAATRAMGALTFTRPRIEYAYHLMALDAGVVMSECRLTRRFDRGEGGERIHLQSLCGLAHLDFNLADTAFDGITAPTSSRSATGTCGRARLSTRA